MLSGLKGRFGYKDGTKMELIELEKWKYLSCEKAFPRRVVLGIQLQNTQRLA